MSVFEIILISMGLAMDAFGVSIGKGLSMPVGENCGRGKRFSGKRQNGF